MKYLTWVNKKILRERKEEEKMRASERRRVREKLEKLEKGE